MSAAATGDRRLRQKAHSDNRRNSVSSVEVVATERPLNCSAVVDLHAVGPQRECRSGANQSRARCACRHGVRRGWLARCTVADRRRGHRPDGDRAVAGRHFPRCRIDFQAGQQQAVRAAILRLDAMTAPFCVNRTRACSSVWIGADGRPPREPRRHCRSIWAGLGSFDDQYIGSF
jgi:hypothetical protein